MDKKRIFQILGNIIEKDADELECLAINTRLKDLDMDSMRFLYFIVSIEEEFDVEFLDVDLVMSKFETIEDMFNTLQTYLDDQKKVVKKVLVCDCDNVLWHGIAGEEEIFMSSLSYQLQQELIQLYNHGVLICLCSRNDKSNIEEAFRTIDMPLRQEHILLAKVDWNNKANNIQAISDDLHLFTDSFVFVDDSEYELGLINAMYPEITTIKADYNNKDFINKIDGYFIQNKEYDLNRTQLYKEQKEREKSKLNYKTIEEYNMSLETIVSCEQATIEQAERISDLSQRTNQFNLSTTRYTEKEISQLIKNEEYIILQLSVTDCYGDMGIVGGAVVHIGNTILIESFYLSCRVFDRKFEYKILNQIKEISPTKKYMGYII